MNIHMHRKMNNRWQEMIALPSVMVMQSADAKMHARPPSTSYVMRLCADDDATRDSVFCLEKHE